MKSIEGVISVLGNATIGSAGKTYSIIDFGNDRVQNVSIPNGLDNYLTSAFHKNEKSKLWISGKKIVGVESGSGIYYAKIKIPFLYWIAFILALPLCLLLVGFLIVAPIGGRMYLAWSINSSTSDLAARGGVPIETYAF